MKVTIMRKSGKTIRTGLSAVVLVFFSTALIFGQAQQGGKSGAGDLSPIDESQFTDSTSSANSSDRSGGGAEGEENIPNAVIEGVQISSEPGDKPDEKVVSCYFIFKDKPSSYFYEVKLKEKKIIFEFNDTKSSEAQIPSAAEPPIKGFIVDQRKVDINKDVKGLKPEYHNQIRVVFSVSAVPDIHVNDEYNVISYSYKWTTDSSKLDKYILKPAPVGRYLTIAGGVAALGGGAAWYFLKPKPAAGPTPIPIDDLPSHPLQTH
jgi:hypothetical protein